MPRFFAISLLLCVSFLSCSEKRYPDALSPEEAIHSFKLNDDDLKIELFVAEPFVADPVEMVFDEQGNVFVVEMPDYPFRPESGIGTGRIRMLIDTSGDGRIDKSTIFADSLLEATSILPWEGGLIVTAAPDIFFLKDTTGDHRADIKQMLFTGFFSNNAETQITNLRFGIDNWIYAANFGQEGKVTSERNPDAPGLLMSGGDFRFRMDRGQFEVETGPTQFGHAIDDWGHRFITENSIHLQQSVIPWRYLHRHPYLPSAKAVENISDHDPLMYPVTAPPYWRVERTKRRNQAFRENNLNRVEYADSHFTAASGTTLYAAATFPQKYYGNIFIGDVSGNLVHRDVLNYNDDSVTFVAKRDDAEKSTEFLTSSDAWFRPVNFTLGPDGALYVIDMYRQHIEAPPFIPEDLKTDMDFLKGNQMGRIYRIVPQNAGPYKHISANLKQAPAAKLVELLSNPNQWWRLQAQRMLLERQDKSVVPQLKDLASHHADPRARLHCLFVLEGLNSLDAKTIKRAMSDTHAGIRESAIILAEKFPDCIPDIIRRTGDSSARVVLQATLSLGQFPGSQTIHALASVIEEHAHNYWFRIAVLSSEAGSSLPLLELLTKRGFFSGESAREQSGFLEDFSYIIGLRNLQAEVLDLIKTLNVADIKKETSLQHAGLTGLAAGLKKSGKKIKNGHLLQEALKKMGPGATTEDKVLIEEIFKVIL